MARNQFKCKHGSMIIYVSHPSLCVHVKRSCMFYLLVVCFFPFFFRPYVVLYKLCNNSGNVEGLVVVHSSLQHSINVAKDVEIQFPMEPSLLKLYELLVPEVTLNESIHQLYLCQLIQFSSKCSAQCFFFCPRADVVLLLAFSPS